MAGGLITMALGNYWMAHLNLIFCAYGVLYANTVSLPALLQSLFAYDAIRYTDVPGSIRPVTAEGPI